MKKTILAIASICSVAAGAADVGRVIVRQQWPWSTNVNVEFELSGVSASAPADISLRCYNGATEIPAATVEAALSGARHGLTSGGTCTVSLDPAVLFDAGTKTVPDFRVTVSASATSATDNEVIYKIIDIATGDTTNLRRADFYDNPQKYGAYVTSLVALGATNEPSNVFIWTGVTNNFDYMSTKLVMRKIKATNVEWPYGSAASLTTARLTNDYWISVFPFTQAQFYTLKGSYGGGFTNGETYPNHERYPVSGIAWRDFGGTTSNGWPVTAADAVSSGSTFGLLSSRSGLIFNFPTEMQWEFAARGGLSDSHQGYSDVKSVAWYRSNAGSSPMEVGRKKPNAFGLYDMLGNVNEWCRDWYAGALPTGTEQTLEDDPGATEGESGAYASAHLSTTNPQRAARGGYYDSATGAPPHVYVRAYKKTNEANITYGLRLWAIER